jgi:broad specificity phosphatase PhoE/ribonuclease HI
MTKPEALIIEADGGSRGNPGPSGSGAVVIDAATGLVIREISEFIGIATNNVAEYRALKAALEEVHRINPLARVRVRMDSKLVIEQMSGNWKIKHPDMRALAIEVQQLSAGLDISFEWIPREENSRADALANKAMDETANVITDTTVNPVPAMVAEFNGELPSSVRAPGHITEPLTTLVLVRHGRTHLTETKKISGSGGENPGLSELGKQDAHRVSVELAKLGTSGAFAHIEPIAAIVASPIQRTVDTANILANHLHRAVTLEPSIQEISFGDWDGHTNDEVARDWPELFEQWRGSWTVSPPNGESLEAFDLRVNQGLDAIIAQHAGKTVAVVAHVMPIRGIIRAAIGGGIESYWNQQVAPCSITILRLWGRQATEVVTINATHHLA